MALLDQINQNLSYASENEMFDTAFSWEPKKQHQFILELDGIPAYLIKTSDKPTISKVEAEACNPCRSGRRGRRSGRRRKRW